MTMESYGPSLVGRSRPLMKLQSRPNWPSTRCTQSWNRPMTVGSKGHKRPHDPAAAPIRNTLPSSRGPRAYRRLGLHSLSRDLRVEQFEQEAFRHDAPTPSRGRRRPPGPARPARSGEPVLLGSIATAKYVDLLLSVFSERLLFPAEFVGRGDMSRGGLMLRCVDQGAELTYVPVLGAIRRGVRPPRLPPRRLHSNSADGPTTAL